MFSSQPFALSPSILSLIADKVALELMAAKSVERSCICDDDVSQSGSPSVRPKGSLPPEVLEAIRRQFGIAHGVLDVFVAEIGLQRPCIVAFVGEGKAAGVSQHVRVGLELEASHGACTLDHPGKAGGGERGTAFGREYERRLRFLLPGQAPQCP
jgi:hypothetical protein